MGEISEPQIDPQEDLDKEAIEDLDVESMHDLDFGQEMAEGDNNLTERKSHRILPQSERETGENKNEITQATPDYLKQLELERDKLCAKFGIEPLNFKKEIKKALHKESVISKNEAGEIVEPLDDKDLALLDFLDKHVSNQMGHKKAA